MLRVTTESVASIEAYSIDDFRNWLIAGHKDLARPDTRARAFDPLHLLVGHGDITQELSSVYDALPGGVQILFRRGLADAISALPTQANSVPVLRALLHLAGRIKALEVLPKFMPQIGAGFFGMPDCDEGRELFALAIDTVASMAPATGTTDTLRSLVGSAFFRSEYAPLVLVSLCRSEPERLSGHLLLLRGHFDKLHAAYGIRNAAITARRVAHYVPLNQMASSLKELELAAPQSIDWLINTLFVGNEAPLRINMNRGIMSLSRRGVEGSEVVQLPESIEEAQGFRSYFLKVIFKSLIEHLPEDLSDHDNVPEVVSFAISSDIPLGWAIIEMDERLHSEKEKRFGSTDDERASLSKEESNQNKDNIKKDLDTIRKRLVDILVSFPIIWNTCQEEIAEIEAISDIDRVIRDWRMRDGLPALVTKMKNCSSYKTLQRYNHPLLEIKRIAEQIGATEPDAGVIEQSGWVLLNSDGKPGSKIISGRLRKSSRNLYDQLARLIDDVIQKRKDKWTTSSQRRLYRLVDKIVAFIPNYKIGFKVSDLCWRAVLLDKAFELEASFDCASKALGIAADNSDIDIENEFMWWSGLADANRIVAKHSGDPMHDGWGQGIEYYEAALKQAEKERKCLIYSRMAKTRADWVATFGDNLTEEASREKALCAFEGRENARKALEFAIDPTSSMYLEARLQALLVPLLRIVLPNKVAEEERSFEKMVENLLKINARHSSVIWLAWEFYNEKGEEDFAIQWLDRQVKILRETEPKEDSNLRIADYIEYQAAHYLISFGRQDEARERLARMVSDTQPNNAEARREYFNIGVNPSHEMIAQNLYKEARTQPPGSQARMNSAVRALEKNKGLINADPEQNDVVPWTRHARLFLFLDEIDQAIDILKILKGKYPQDPYVYFHLGEAYYRRGQANEINDQAQKHYTQAIVEFENAYRIFPRVDTSHRLAACWSRRGDHGKAQHYLQKADKIDPKDGWTKLSLGWIHYQNDEVEQAFQYWRDALNCLTTELYKDQRAMVLAKQAANAIVRYVELLFTEKSLTHFTSPSLYMLATVASNAGWNRSKITITIAERIEEVPLWVRRRVPHALRAHLLYLQLSEGKESAYQWHKNWFGKLKDIKDPRLFFEYVAGAKGIFRRAVSWQLSQDSFEVLSLPNVELDEVRWGEFLEIVSTWGVQKNYYTRAYAAWPEDVNCDELWEVICRLNVLLLDKASGEVGWDGRTLPTDIISSKLANTMILEPEIISARELDSTLPKNYFVQTDDYSARILLKSSRKFIEHYASSEVREEWDQGRQLSWSCYDGAKIPSIETEAIKMLALRSDINTEISDSGIKLSWPSASILHMHPAELT